MERKTILVTGGAGFIGSHLCERLVSLGFCDVYSLDNYFTGSKDNHVENVIYIQGSTNDIAQLITFKPDLIYHLGEYSRVEQSLLEIENVWRLNQEGTFAVLEFVRKVGCKIIYAGSSTKFGDDGLGRYSSPYAWFKACNTELVKNYSVWYGIQYAITYFYNVYGHREIKEGNYATLIAIFKEKMRTNETLTVVSPGDQRRNFTHIDDIVEGLVLVGDKGYGDEYGIGHPDDYSVIEIAHMFGEDIEYLPKREGNRMNAPVITSKTEALGWKATKAVDAYIMEAKKNNWNY